jgi:hypothetical protein
MAAYTRSLALVASIAACSSSSAPGQKLWAAYQPGDPRPCYRQPLIVALDDHRLVAFVEGRNNSYCSGAADGSNSSIYSRSSGDGGLTWSQSIELLHAPPQPDYLSAVATKSGLVHLFVQSSPNVQLTSRDGGATFSAPAPVKVALPQGFTATPGVASGIQVDGTLCAEPTCGGAAGRLVVAWVCHAAKDGAAHSAVRSVVRGAARSAARNVVRGAAPGARDVSCVGCYSCLAFSDDDGETWTISAVSNQDGSREASLAQLEAAAYPGASGAVVYASERNMGAAPGSRWHAVSTDSGKSFSSFGTDPGLPDGEFPAATSSETLFALFCLTTLSPSLQPPPPPPVQATPRIGPAFALASRVWARHWSFRRRRRRARVPTWASSAPRMRPRTGRPARSLPPGRLATATSRASTTRTPRLSLRTAQTSSRSRSISQSSKRKRGIEWS